jgi:hypothetical protein
MFSSMPTRIAVLFTLSTLRLVAFPQNFKVLVLDALNGKTQQNVKVDYFCEGRSPDQLNSPIESVLTGPDGMAQVPYKCASGARIELSVFPPGDGVYAKEECGGEGGVTIDEIMKTGFIADPSSDGNIWCPRRVSKKLKPVPAQVIIFVKKPTWWQAHVAG